MANLFNLFRLYSAKARVRYVGTATIRGIPCDHWTAALPWPGRRTLTLACFFRRGHQGEAEPGGPAARAPVRFAVTGTRPAPSVAPVQQDARAVHTGGGGGGGGGRTGNGAGTGTSPGTKTTTREGLPPAETRVYDFLSFKFGPPKDSDRLFGQVRLNCSPACALCSPS